MHQYPHVRTYYTLCLYELLINIVVPTELCTRVCCYGGDDCVSVCSLQWSREVCNDV